MAENSDIRRLVDVNQDIKRVVVDAFRIRQSALNALFAARRVGVRAAGYGVIATEVRELSGLLNESMRTLRGRANEALSTVATLARDQHRGRIVEQAAATPRARACLDATRERRAARRAGHAAALRSANRRLRDDLDETLRLSQLGATLSSFAKIEAAYAAEHSGDLATATADLDAALGRVLPLLRALAKRV